MCVRTRASNCTSLRRCFWLVVFFSSENSYTCFVYLAVVLGQPAGLSTEMYARAGWPAKAPMSLKWWQKFILCMKTLTWVANRSFTARKPSRGLRQLVYNLLIKSSHHPEQQRLHRTCPVLFFIIWSWKKLVGVHVESGLHRIWTGLRVLELCVWFRWLTTRMSLSF